MDYQHLVDPVSEDEEVRPSSYHNDLLTSTAFENHEELRGHTFAYVRYNMPERVEQILRARPGHGEPHHLYLCTTPA